MGSDGHWKSVCVRVQEASDHPARRGAAQAEIDSWRYCEPQCTKVQSARPCLALPSPAQPCPALPGPARPWRYSQVIYTDGRPSGVTSMQSSGFVTGYREALAVPTQPASHCGYSQTVQGPLSSAIPASSHFCVKIIWRLPFSQVSG